MEKLAQIQRELKAPKGQLNEFGGFNYRSCEDILTAVKPLLGDATLIISDEIVLIGDRYYVRATVILKQGKEIESAIAFARETATKKGMDEAQITGAASSYARKYALNGLFAIDDTKDLDSSDNRPPKEKEVDKMVKSVDLLAGYTDAIDKFNSSVEIEKYTNSVYQNAKKELSEIDYNKFIKYSKDAVQAWGLGKKDVGTHVKPGDDLPL
jgi:hypothetical protein